jgi:hypothetical protein
VLPIEEDVDTVKKLFDRLAGRNRSDDTRGPPIVNEASKQARTSRIMGMTMEVVFQGSEVPITVAEALLATSEAFFATAAELKVLPHTKHVSIEIVETAAEREPEFTFDRGDMRGEPVWPSGKSPASLSASGREQNVFLSAAGSIMDATCYLKNPREVR